MKGVILSGGTGSRLRPITHTGPKQLIPVANKPVIDYAIEDLAAAGIDDIAVVLGEQGREEIQSYIDDGSRYGVEVTYIVQGEPLGLAHAIGCARDFVGSGPFVVFLGDNILREGIGSIVEDFDPEQYGIGIGLQRVDEPSRYGIVEVDEDGDIVGLFEKPDYPPSDLALIGVYVFTDPIFEAIETLKPSQRGEYEITEAIQWVLEEGHSIQSHLVHGWWKDTGRPEDILHANRLVLDDLEKSIDGNIEEAATIRGRLSLGKGSVIESGATVRGPVSIGTETHITSEAYVGPYTSIGNECTIDDVHIEASVVVGDSTLSCKRTVIDSLIGRGANITSDEGRKPAGARLVVGENSSIDL